MEYRDEVQRVVGWCANNNLALNVSKTKEMIVVLLTGMDVEQVESFNNLKRTQLGQEHTVHHTKNITTSETRHCSGDLDTFLPRNN